MTEWRQVLSKRQYAMLEMFVDMGVDTYLTIEEAENYDQRPFRSMLIQQWISYHPTRGFHVTKKGISDWQDYQAADIARGPNMKGKPLCGLFDPAANVVKLNGHGRRTKVA